MPFFLGVKSDLDGKLRPQPLLRVGQADRDRHQSRVAVGRLADEDDLPRAGRFGLALEPDLGRLVQGDLVRLNGRKFTADVKFAEVDDLAPDQGAWPGDRAGADVQPGNLAVNRSGQGIKFQFALSESQFRLSRLRLGFVAQSRGADLVIGSLGKRPVVRDFSARSRLRRVSRAFASMLLNSFSRARTLA